MQNRGYIWVSPAQDSRFADAAVGSRVRNADRRPPYIVVHEAPTISTIAAWPGRLLQVHILDEATDADGAGSLDPSTSYSRAVEVEIVAELPTKLLFGDHGAQVIEVIELARRLTRVQAALLAAAVDSRAAAAYLTAWNDWLRAESARAPSSPRTGGPFIAGFSLISLELRSRAVSIDGVEAIEMDHDGESLLLQPWRGAERALLHAAMALAAPTRVEEHARSWLLAAWNILEIGGASHST